MFFLKSQHLGWRHWHQEDLPLAQQLWGDARVTKFIAGGMTAEQVAERLRREIAQQEEFTVQYWPIFWLESGEFVGCCGLRPYENIYELGFHLRPEFWGKGLAEEAGRAVIQYAFNVMQVKELFAGHHPDNRPSWRVLEKLGFIYVGDEIYPPTGLMNPGYRLRNNVL
ncbi:GCN5-related N-acetyltransferase [Candidatus Koribacter versatilis Ellin345]|uniref:GCN5-related N-acetyltransferase n=1 Tax=Koribacter versatilis (strain Ellin345) TaxID=204669 RepID=Q1IKP9_KORVE|nr:GNAT family N-acetyltransferase [Candidatus Koribacter versatilis]ABF42551.1 GCN5-related N-acetyltransferase [Candidatus Koribacter versatilis Ellin345]